MSKSREQRRRESEERKRNWQQLSPEEKLRELERRPGKCTKEKERIRRQMNKGN